MTAYGSTKYGISNYGYTVPPNFRVDPFIAQPADYSSISISWTKPTGTVYAWRLVKNMNGFPTDQNDGQVILDSAAIPLNSNNYFAGGSSTGWVGFNGTFSVVPNPPAGATYPYAGLFTITSAGSGAAMEESGASFTALPNQSYQVTALVWTAQTTCVIGFDWQNSSHGYISTSTQTITVTPNTWTQVTASNLTAPVGTAFAYPRIAPTDGNGNSIYAQAVLATANIAVGYPGNSFSDVNVTAGAFHYYGFYLQTNAISDTWVRGGLTGCLMVQNYGSASQMQQMIPSFYVNAVNTDSELQTDDVGNLFLNKFMQVFGWGFDYLRTQYDTYQNVNNPWTIPLDDLYALATEVNININPDIHPYTLRKAIYNNAGINKLRGTVQGMEAEVSALTGYFADITIGPNMMLNNDQSYFLDPLYPQWSASISYLVNERVSYGNYFYQCISTGNLGHAPTGTTSPNTWWQVEQNIADTTVLANTATGGLNTWELIYPGVSNGGPSVGTMAELIGIPDPITPANNQANGLRGTNANGSTSDMWLKTPSRSTADKTVVTTTFAPNTYQAAADGIPVPYTAFASNWNATTTYAPQQVVIYSNQPFIALRASKNSVPPYASPGTSTMDWAPLGFDNRFRVAVSAYVNSQAANNVTPFVEWYDAGGNFITRLQSRNPGSTVAVPDGLCYASFVPGANQTLAAYAHTDDMQFSWTTQTGSFSISPYNGGCAYPTVNGTRSISTVNTGSANAQVGITFTTNPTAGNSSGLILRYAATNSYLRADMTTLKQNNGGTITTLGTYSTPCVAGDRLMVQLNGNSITVLRNNVSVLTTTSSFNNTATIFGIISETT